MRQPPMIAIVDDDESVRTATASLVRSLGFSTGTFAGAEEFLASPLLEQASCIITDVQMPGMSGIEMQAALRRRGVTTPLIFITAFPEERLRRQVTEAGAVAFLAKPFDGTEMIAWLERMVGPAL